MKPLRQFNEGKPYREQIKPFNFLLTLQTACFGHPPGVDTNHFHLIGPYETDPKKWLKAKWIDQYTGKQYRITTSGSHGDRHAARVKTYGDVLDEYEFHPESKCADKDGDTCGKQTVGLLRRRNITIERIVYIGKESNRLEEVESGMVQDGASVYTEYPDPRRDEWHTTVLEKLKKMKLSNLVAKSGMSRRAILDLRAGRSRPHRKNEKLLKTIVNEYHTDSE